MKTKSQPTPTPAQIKEWPHLALSESAKKELYLEASDLLGANMHSLLDASTVVHMAHAAYDPEGCAKLGIDFITHLKRLYRCACNMRAEELGVTDRTMQNWVERHGIGILRLSPEGNERLFQCLGMRQRREKSVNIWMNEYRKRRKVPTKSPH